MFDNFFPARKGNGDEGFESAVWRPVVDVHEDEHNFIVDCELPGLSREDIKINFQDGTLSISGERNYTYEQKPNEANGTVQDKGKSAHRVERFYGKFHRSFTFPTAVNPDAIKANFDHGVLTVTVPKAEEVKPRLIEIG